jgi:hypothetical protein
LLSIIIILGLYSFGGCPLEEDMNIALFLDYQYIASLEGHGGGIALISRWRGQECARDVHSTSMPRLLSQASEHKLRGILDLVHLDVCGPMSSTSLTGNIYYISFIDDSSRKTWIYFMKTKDEVFSRFQEFKALVEN